MGSGAQPELARFIPGQRNILCTGQTGGKYHAKISGSIAPIALVGAKPVAVFKRICNYGFGTGRYAGVYLLRFLSE